MVVHSVEMLLHTSESNASVKLTQEKSHLFVLKKVKNVKDAMVLSSMVLESLMDM